MNRNLLYAIGLLAIVLPLVLGPLLYSQNETTPTQSSPKNIKSYLEKNKALTNTNNLNVKPPLTESRNVTPPSVALPVTSQNLPSEKNTEEPLPPLAPFEEEISYEEAERLKAIPPPSNEEVARRYEERLQEARKKNLALPAELHSYEKMKQIMDANKILQQMPSD